MSQLLFHIYCADMWYLTSQKGLSWDQHISENVTM